MRLNVALLFIAAFLVGFVLYRTGAVKFDRRFWIELAPLIVAAIFLVWVNYKIGGSNLAAEGFRQAWVRGVSLMPMLILMFLTMGGGSALVEYYKSEVIEYMNGGHGFVGSVLAGFATPGGIASLPIVRDLWEGGAGHAQLLVFLISTRLLNWQITVMMGSIVGWNIIAIQYVWSILIMVLITLGFWAWTVVSVARV